MLKKTDKYLLIMMYRGDRRIGTFGFETLEEMNKYINTVDLYSWSILHKLKIEEV
jgi:hypothetical protein